MFDISCGLDNTNENIVSVDTPTIESVLSGWGTSLGLDIAPNHTGIFLWDDDKKTWHTYGFKVGDDISQDDVYYDAKVRRFFYSKYEELFRGIHFSHICVEGCYGGDNYETVKQLLNINTVIDELVLDGKIGCDNLYRVKPSKWLSGLSMLSSMKGGYSTKYKTQEILKQIGYEFALSGVDKPQKYLKDIFYEDICDATGLVLGLRMLEKAEISVNKSREIGLSKIEVHYLSDYDEIYELYGGFAHNVCVHESVINKRTIEKEIKRLVNDDASQVYCVRLQNSDLGSFGIKRDFEYFNQGYGWLVFYYKGLRTVKT